MKKIFITLALLASCAYASHNGVIYTCDDKIIDVFLEAEKKYNTTNVSTMKNENGE